MPTSHHKQISKILDLVILNNPKSVLDIGTGFGKYGMLIREYLELWDGRENYKDFRRVIDGIEAYPDYITPVHKFIYDNLYIGNASSVINNLSTEYDLVLLIDVLEHFEQLEGEIIINKILKRNKVLLISVPKLVEDQDDSFGNPFEIHKSQWSKKNFREYGATYFKKDDYSIIVCIGDLSNIYKGINLRRKDKLKNYKLKVLSYIPDIVLKPYRFVKYRLINKSGTKS